MEIIQGFNPQQEKQAEEEEGINVAWGTRQMRFMSFQLKELKHFEVQRRAATFLTAVESDVSINGFSPGALYPGTKAVVQLNVQCAWKRSECQFSLCTALSFVFIKWRAVHCGKCWAEGSWSSRCFVWTHPIATRTTRIKRQNWTYMFGWTVPLSVCVQSHRKY